VDFGSLRSFGAKVKLEVAGMTTVRLIALDLDGTLLDDEKKVPDRNVEAIQEAARRGFKIAISTGRMVPRIEPIQDRLGVDCLVLAYNGGKVVGTRAEGRPLIRHKPVPADIAELFLDYSREHDLLLNFVVDDLLFAEDAPSRRRFSDLYSRRTGAEYHFVDLDAYRGKEPTKMILFGDEEDVLARRDSFRAQLGPRAYVTISEPEYLEIMSPEVNKGEALRELAAHYSFDMSEVLAVGDAENDAPMLEVAGVSVAVANACETTKALAHHMTDATNNDGAVAEAIERFAFGAG